MGVAQGDIRDREPGGPGRAAVPPRKRRRLRSRNQVVDAWLAEEESADAFADLEDFIVTKRGRLY